jgi:hypothetical protein
MIIDAAEEMQKLFGAPFQDVAELENKYSIEVDGYRWDEPLVIEIWRKANGTYYAMPTRKELCELLSLGDSTLDALRGFIMRFRLETKLWKRK